MTDSAKEELVLQGIAASPGVVHGQAFVYLQNELDVPCYTVASTDLDSEVERFEQAILATRGQITEVRNKIAESLGEGEARIFDAHLMVLEDSALIDEVVAEVRSSQQNVEHCYNNVAQRYISFFSSMDDDYLKERVTDIQDVSRRLLHNLVGVKKLDLGHLEHPSIIVSQDLTPSDTADIDRHKLQAFITDQGGKTSHSVIMARSLRIPAVVGMHDVSQRIRTGDQVLVDGYDGVVVINPSEDRLFQYGQLASERLKLDKIFKSVLREPSESLDGQPIGLMANIEGAQEMEVAQEMGADGVGLFRTEGVFLRHRGYPSEDAQYEEYAAVVQAAGNSPVIIRTLDIGGDKTIGNPEQEEDSSFMGFRAIRFCLENPTIFKTQLRAILRASASGTVKLMYPMISGLHELRRANEFLDEVKAELRAEGSAFDEGIEVGAMIEIPSAAMIIDLLAPEVDFFSIGTNDLIQYLMAVDRLNDQVAHLYEPAHPAVLRTLKAIINSCNAVNVPVGVCGEIAGDPIYASLLLGMGANSLSLTASLLPEVKYFIRKMHTEQAQALVEEVLQINDPIEVVGRLEDFRKETIGALMV
ncbi:MAG: phosphoenolpyruvate--protein phosphotransferase [Opitutales bacterium]